MKARMALGAALVLGTMVAVETPAWAATAEDDFFDVSRLEATTIDAPGVLGNDDVEGETSIGCDAAQFGTVECDPSDGSFTYTPGPEALLEESDSFTYTVTDDEDPSTATVTLTLTPAFVVADDSCSPAPVLAGQTCSVNVLANDTGGDLLEVQGVQPNGDPQGTFTFGPDGDFTYTPNESHPGGTTTFTYTVTVPTEPQAMHGRSARVPAQQPLTGTITATVTPAQEPTTTTAAQTTTTRRGGTGRQTTTTRSRATTTSAPRVARTGVDDPSTLGPIAVGLIGAGALAIATRRRLLSDAHR
ncbi:MAG: Ig-like domain-containing protein [Acidimicrobiales bacterium]